jgi:vesicle-fusing ATPase
MVQEIQPIYDQLILQTGHKFPFKFKGTFFLLTVKEIKCVKMKEQGKVIPIEAAYGVWQQNRTSVQFMRSPESLLNLTGKAVSMTGNIINPDFDFSKVGIGGLDEEFKEIFRRAFASRIFPPDVVENPNSILMIWSKKFSLYTINLFFKLVINFLSSSRALSFY